MHEASTRNFFTNRLTLRFTSNILNKKTGRRGFRSLYLAMLAGNAQLREEHDMLRVYSRRTNLIEEYISYLVSRSNSESANVVRDHFTNRNTENLGQPLYRWWKLRRKMKQIKLYQKLAKDLANLKVDFLDPQPTLIIGNWGGGNARFQEPTPGVGLYRRLAALGGFKIFFIDEFKSSLTCPRCEQRTVETFNRVQNPRPYRVARNPMVTRHGLLRYKYI
jgi:hypothetical protein